MTAFNLSLIEFFAATQVIYFVGYIFTKNEDAHFLKERDVYIKYQKSLLTVLRSLTKGTDVAIPTFPSSTQKFHHQWWHNFEFLYTGLFCIVWPVLWLGFTWSSLFLCLSLGSLYMLMDVVLNIKMGWPKFHLGDGVFDKTFNFIVRLAGWIIFSGLFIFFN